MSSGVSPNKRIKPASIACSTRNPLRALLAGYSQRYGSMKYVLDTNVVNWLVDRKINGTMLPSDGVFVATHVQIDEINRTSNEDRRARLYITLASSLSGLLPTETFVAGVSRPKPSQSGDGKVYNSIKAGLDALNGGRQSNVRDALIAEVCLVNSHTLLTADQDLATVTSAHGGMVHVFKP